MLKTITPRPGSTASFGQQQQKQRVYIPRGATHSPRYKRTAHLVVPTVTSAGYMASGDAARFSTTSGRMTARVSEQHQRVKHNIRCLSERHEAAVTSVRAHVSQEAKGWKNRTIFD